MKETIEPDGMKEDKLEESPLFTICNPQSVAFFGASDDPSLMGTTLLCSVRDLGFEGRIYPVHPRKAEVQGLRAYKEVDMLPETPDLAVLVLPTASVGPVMEACGRKGIGRLIVVSAGFKELGGEGVKAEAELRDIAHRHGLRFLGPNCIGVVNTRKRFNTTFMPYTGRPGAIGIASQSGSFVTQMFHRLERLKAGVSTGISCGNEADLDLVDCLEYLGACPDTRVVVLYVEGIRRGRKFIEVARRVASRKPVVAFYGGGTEAGRAAGRSHTGALAGPDRIYSGAFKQAGVIRANTITELFDLAVAFSIFPEAVLPVPEGGVMIQTHSGGPGAAAADACGREGLSMAVLAQEARQKLMPLLPRTTSGMNPLDLTFMKSPMDYFGRIPEILLEDPNVHQLLVYLLLPVNVVKQFFEQAGLGSEEAAAQTSALIEAQCETMSEICRRAGKPILTFTFRSLDEQFPQGLMERGIPVFPDPRRAARAARALAEYQRIKQRLSSSRG